MGNYATGHELIAYNNLPLRRWKISRIRTAHDKRLRAIDKEHAKVCNQLWNLGYEDLNPPIRKGYKRLFVLSESTKNSSRAEFYENILEKINTIRYSPDKLFKEKKKRRIKKWKYLQQPPQMLKEIDSREFHREGRFTDEEKSYFYEVEFFHYQTRMYVTIYIFKEPWRYELKVKAHYITRIRKKDLLLEQRRDELTKYLERNENKRRLVKMRGGNGYAWKKIIHKKEDKRLYAYNSLNNIPLHYVVSYYKEEKEWK